MKNLHLVLILLVSLCFISEISADHLIGGDATYSFVEFNNDSTTVTFRVRFNLYKDSNNGAQLGNTETFGIYRQDDNGDWTYVNEIRPSIRGNQDVPGVDEPCRDEPPRSVVAVETAFYEDFVTLDIIDNNYMIAYQRCCRNDGINNVFADEQGGVIEIIITPLAQRTGNNGPTFNEFPPIFICAGFPLDVSQECTDLDGDIMRYSFCTPLTAGGPRGGGCTSPNPPPRNCAPPFDELVYRNGFSLLAPMAGNPVVQIDGATGLITGTPETQGLFAVSICVEEFRNGELLSFVRRDFQFNSLTCIKELSADLVADEQVIDNSMSTLPINIIKACGDSLVNFSAIDNNNTIIKYHWIVDDPNGNRVIDSSGAAVRNIDVIFPELGEYEGRLAVEDSEGCTDTSILRVLRLPDMDADFEFEVLDTCYFDELAFTDLSTAETSQIVEWLWDVDGDTTYTEQNPSHQFTTRGLKEVTLVSKDLNTCVDTFVTLIDYNPPLDQLFTQDLDVTLCFGDSIFFQERWIKIAGQYSDTMTQLISGCDSLHRFLDLSYFPEPRETRLDTTVCPGEVVEYFGVTYSEEGSHFHTTESVTFTSGANSCDSLLHFLELEIEDLPEAIFAPDMDFVIAERDYAFPLRITGDYDNILWSPSDGLSCTDCPSPTVNSDIDTVYTITLTTDDNCVVESSFTADFVVVPEKYFISNILLKNSIDNQNQSFYLQTQDNAVGEVEYDIQVYDRLGGLMFEGLNLDINDSNVGWIPRDLNAGVYVYTIEVREFFETRKFSGTITLTE